jgi:peptide/nickel transport system permease protein
MGGGFTGDEGRSMSGVSSAAEFDALAAGPGIGVAVGPPVEPIPPGAPAKEIIGRSPGQLAWLRLKRDRTALWSAVVLAFFVVLGFGAPLVELVYGKAPQQTFPGTLDNYSIPLGYLGGVSGEHWFGVQPRTSQDLFILVVYGLRTSFIIAFTSAIVTIITGILIGIVAGYLGGWVDRVLSWVIDVTLAFPFFVFALAAVPLLTNRFYTTRDDVPPWFRGLMLILIFTAFNWTYTARLVRGQVLSLREREFVEAARAAGAGTRHILFRQLLPNLWAPILVTFSLNVPAFITAEAALSFIGVGLVEPTPDLGRLIFDSTHWVRNDPAYTMIPASVIFLVVLAFNLFGDALRDAVDPKSSR